LIEGSAAIDDLIAKLHSSDGHETSPPATPAEVAMTEQAVGRSLPPTFVRFLREFSNGAYLYGVQEVSRVGESGSQIAAIQDIHRGSSASDRIDLDAGGSITFGDLLPFALDSNGEWCFVAGDSAESSVGYRPYDQARLYCALPAFEQWLRILVDAEDEVIRAVADEATVDRMNLG
jgi:hypothetical protein